MNKLGIDVSLWDFKLDVPLLKDAGVETVVVKLGQARLFGKADKSDWLDPKFLKHAEAAAKGGLHLQVYYWDDIVIDPTAQADWVADTLAKTGFPVTFVWADAEQWWTDWTKLNQAKRGEIPYSAVPFAKPANISLHYQNFMQTLNDFFPDRCGVYTNNGFTSSWSPDIAKWVGKYPHWNPQYTKQPPKGYVCEWAELRAKWLPTVFPKPLAGSTAVQMVAYQFTGDTFKLPGVTDQFGRRIPLDVNLFTDEFLTSVTKPIEYGLETVPVVPVTPVTPVTGQYVVTASALNIRAGPGINYGYAGSALSLNTVVNVTGFSGAWAHLSTGAWCSMMYLVKKVVAQVPLTVVPVLYIVNVWLLNIRKGPGTNYGYAGAALPQHTVVGVVETVGEWAKLVSGVWCYAPYLVKEV